MDDYEVKLNHCIQILTGFPKDSKSLTVHVDEYFSVNEMSNSERQFIVDVFAETIKYYKILQAVIERFYQEEGRTLFLKDKNLYYVLLFLIVFRVDEVGVGGIRKFVATQKIKVMHKFLAFVVSEESLFGWIQLEWLKLYDTTFVENELLDKLKRHLPELQRFVREMQDLIDNKPLKGRKPPPKTKIEAFDLTQPKPRRIPIPELVPEMEKPKEVPETTYSPEEIITKLPKKDPNLLLQEAEKLKPSCADTSLSTKTLERMDKIVAQQHSQLQFQGVRARAVPKSNSRDANHTVKVKPTAAVILREWRLYEKKQHVQNQQLRDLVEGGFSAAQFEAWQADVRAEELAREMAGVELRRLAGQLSVEEAAERRRRLVADNAAAGASVRAENRRRLDAVTVVRSAEDCQRRETAAKHALEASDLVKEARAAVRRDKRAIAQEITAESRRLQEEALLEAELEMRRKLELIAEIRALEGSYTSGAAVGQVVDKSQVAGYGFLCEMSLTELVERLELERRRQEGDRLKRHQEIRGERERKHERLVETEEMLQLLRNNNKTANSKENTKVTLRSGSILGSQPKAEIRTDTVRNISRILSI